MNSRFSIPISTRKNNVYVIDGTSRRERRLAQGKRNIKSMPKPHLKCQPRLKDVSWMVGTNQE